MRSARSIHLLYEAKRPAIEFRKFKKMRSCWGPIGNNNKHCPKCHMRSQTSQELCMNRDASKKQFLKRALEERDNDVISRTEGDTASASKFPIVPVQGVPRRGPCRFIAWLETSFGQSKE